MRNFDDKYLLIAEIFGSMSNCVSHQVGCIFVKDGRILTSGYNGTPSGYKNNCSDVFNEYNPEIDREAHKKFSNNTEIHAELNSIIFAATNGINISGSSVYCTLQPCMDCTKALAQAKIKQIIYLNKYDRITEEQHKEQKEFLNDCGITIGQYNKKLKRVEW